jgi:chitin synthase
MVVDVNFDFRKVEGEAKGESHGETSGKFTGIAVPLRRWEDWEKSRLRKLRREEKRRREFERLHGGGGFTGDEYLRGDVRSQYDGSDTISLASSDDDHWGAQIGEYNENSVQYPPPPVPLILKHSNVSGETLGAADLEAMLESGFDESPPSSQPPSQYNTLQRQSRYQLTDGPALSGNGYAPIERYPSPTTPILSANGVSSSVAAEWKTHVKKRSGSRNAPKDYGPLGPLDPGHRI